MGSYYLMVTFTFNPILAIINMVSNLSLRTLHSELQSKMNLLGCMMQGGEVNSNYELSNPNHASYKRENPSHQRQNIKVG